MTRATETEFFISRGECERRHFGMQRKLSEPDPAAVLGGPARGAVVVVVAAAVVLSGGRRDGSGAV